MIKYTKSNGYLLLATASFFVLRELWNLREILNESEWYWLERFNQFYVVVPSFRWSPLVRLIAAVLWILGLSIACPGLRLENRRFIQPAKYLFLLEVFTYVAELLTFSIWDENFRHYTDYVYVMFKLLGT